MMEKIEWNHFFIETKDKISPELYKLLNPNTMSFYKCETTYLALEFNLDTITVCMAVGKGSNFFRELGQTRLNGYKFVKFKTSVDNLTVNAIAKYYKAEFIGFETDTYGPGKHSRVYIIDLNNSRFRHLVY